MTRGCAEHIDVIPFWARTSDRPPRQVGEIVLAHFPFTPNWASCGATARPPARHRGLFEATHRNAADHALGQEDIEGDGRHHDDRDASKEARRITAQVLH